MVKGVYYRRKNDGSLEPIGIIGEESNMAAKASNNRKVEKENFDTISNPAHYTQGRKYEPRKVIEDWKLGFYTGNAVKYISRAGRKGDAVEDMRKAVQYLNWEIERLLNEADESEEE